MLLVWVALCWMVGIVATDMLYQTLHITQPINMTQVVHLALLNETRSTGEVIALLQRILIVLAGIGVISAIYGKWRSRTREMVYTPLRQNRLQCKNLHSKTLIVAGLCLASSACGGLCYISAQVTTTPNSIWHAIDSGNVVVQGVVQADPRWDETGQQVFLDAEQIYLEQTAQPIPVEGVVLVKLPPYPAYQYGERLLLQGKLRQPPAARKPNAFDYRAYLARQGVFTMIYEPEVQRMPGKSGNPLLASILTLRDYGRAILLRELPEPQASVAAGILLGLKSSIPDDVYDTFSKVGTTHLLVISGWHLTIVASVFATLATRLRWGKKTTFWSLVSAIWLYAIFVGMSESVMRAAVMASLTVLAQATARQTQPWILLLVACMALSFFNPQALWSLGFQLSALATASLFAFATPINQWLERVFHIDFWQTKGISLRWITEPLGVTLAAQVLALPIILYHFGNLSIISPLANIVLVPVMPYAMLAGAIALIAGMLWLPLGQWLAAIIAWFPLAWLTEGANILAHVPWASMRLPVFPFWVIMGYYICIAIWHTIQQYVNKKKTITNHSAQQTQHVPKRVKSGQM